MVDVVKVTFDWEYRSMTARYSGSGSVDMVASESESHDDLVERAYELARQRVCRRSSFAPMLVEIRRLKVHGLSRA